jgi:hypothetical protein
VGHDRRRRRDRRTRIAQAYHPTPQSVGPALRHRREGDEPRVARGSAVRAAQADAVGERPCRLRCGESDAALESEVREPSAAAGAARRAESRHQRSGENRDPAGGAGVHRPEEPDHEHVERGFRKARFRTLEPQQPHVQTAVPDRRSRERSQATEDDPGRTNPPDEGGNPRPDSGPAGREPGGPRPHTSAGSCWLRADAPVRVRSGGATSRLRYSGRRDYHGAVDARNHSHPLRRNTPL